MFRCQKCRCVIIILRYRNYTPIAKGLFMDHSAFKTDVSADMPSLSIQPFDAGLVFPDVEAAVLAQEDAVQPTSAWVAFLARLFPQEIEPHAARLRLLHGVT